MEIIIYPSSGGYVAELVEKGTREPTKDSHCTEPMKFDDLMEWLMYSNWREAL